MQCRTAAARTDSTTHTVMDPGEARQILRLIIEDDNASLFTPFYCLDLRKVYFPIAPFHQHHVPSLVREMLAIFESLS